VLLLLLLLLLLPAAAAAGSLVVSIWPPVGAVAAQAELHWLA
jgi:hypothetical protein